MSKSKPRLAYILHDGYNIILIDWLTPTFTVLPVFHGVNLFTAYTCCTLVVHRPLTTWSELTLKWNKFMILLQRFWNHYKYAHFFENCAVWVMNLCSHVEGCHKQKCSFLMCQRHFARDKLYSKTRSVNISLGEWLLISRSD
jgi:hypothetical protein